VIGRAQHSAALASRINNTQDVSGRAATYLQAWDLFRRHPLMGVGISQFGAAQTSELMVESVAGVEAVSSPHDSYLEALSEGGLLVFVPFVAVTVASAAMIHRYRKLGAGDRQEVLIGAAVMAGVLAYFVMSLEETVIISSTASNAFVAILLGACARRVGVLERGHHLTAG
jgi:O-antigen ligase